MRSIHISQYEVSRYQINMAGWWTADANDHFKKRCLLHLIYEANKKIPPKALKISPLCWKRYAIASSQMWVKIRIITHELRKILTNND